MVGQYLLIFTRWMDNNFEIKLRNNRSVPQSNRIWELMYKNMCETVEIGDVETILLQYI